ncbi:MAG: hypothetical protein J5801_01985 [Bacteroidales bacterium]|nr:hypothetical protein [Bacteroidales bacterium]
MRRFLLILLAALAVAGCKSEEGDRIARVGDHILYKQDIERLLPQGISAEDSSAMVEQYVKTWALAHLKLMKAEEVLSADEKDITAEVEDYRSNLLNYRFEHNYTEARLDTTVTDDEMRSYYDSHSGNYKYPYIIAKARIITLSQNSPHYNEIKKTYDVTDKEKVEELREVCQSYAERYDEFGGAWMAMPTIAKSVPGLDAESCETIFRGSNKYIKVGDGKDYFIFLTDKIPVGSLAPYDYCKQTIKDAILINRKQDLMTQLEQELLQEGIESNKLTIYNVDE